MPFSNTSTTVIVRDGDDYTFYRVNAGQRSTVTEATFDALDGQIVAGDDAALGSGSLEGAIEFAASSGMIRITGNPNSLPTAIACYKRATNHYQRGIQFYGGVHITDCRIISASNLRCNISAYPALSSPNFIMENCTINLLDNASALTFQREGTFFYPQQCVIRLRNVIVDGGSAAMDRAQFETFSGYSPRNMLEGFMTITGRTNAAHWLELESFNPVTCVKDFAFISVSRLRFYGYADTAPKGSVHFDHSGVNSFSAAELRKEVNVTVREVGTSTLIAGARSEVAKVIHDTTSYAHADYLGSDGNHILTAQTYVATESTANGLLSFDFLLAYLGVRQGINYGNNSSPQPVSYFTKNNSKEYAFDIEVRQYGHQTATLSNFDLKGLARANNAEIFLFVDSTIAETNRATVLAYTVMNLQELHDYLTAFYVTNFNLPKLSNLGSNILDVGSKTVSLLGTTSSPTATATSITYRSRTVLGGTLMTTGTVNLGLNVTGNIVAGTIAAGATRVTGDVTGDYQVTAPFTGNGQDFTKIIFMTGSGLVSLTNCTVSELENRTGNTLNVQLSGTTTPTFTETNGAFNFTDSVATILLPTGYDIATIHTTQANADAGTNALSGLTRASSSDPWIWMYNSSTYGNTTVFIRGTSSTDSTTELIASQDVPAGTSTTTFTALQFGETVQLQEINRKLDALTTSVGDDLSDEVGTILTNTENIETNHQTLLDRSALNKADLSFIRSKVPQDGILPSVNSLVDRPGFIYDDFETGDFSVTARTGVALSLISKTVNSVTTNDLAISLTNISNVGTSFSVISPTFAASYTITETDHFQLRARIQNISSSSTRRAFHFEFSVDILEGSRVIENSDYHRVNFVIPASDQSSFVDFTIPLGHLSGQATGTGTGFWLKIRNSAGTTASDGVRILIDKLSIQARDEEGYLAVNTLQMGFSDLSPNVVTAGGLVNVNATQIAGRTVNPAAIASDGFFSNDMLGRSPGNHYPILTGSENIFVLGLEYLVQRPNTSDYYLAVSTASAQSLQPFDSSGNINADWRVQDYSHELAIAAVSAQANSINTVTDKLDTMIENDPSNAGDSRFTEDSLAQAPSGSGGTSSSEEIEETLSLTREIVSKMPRESIISSNAYELIPRAFVNDFPHTGSGRVEEKRKINVVTSLASSAYNAGDYSGTQLELTMTSASANNLLSLVPEELERPFFLEKGDRVGIVWGMTNSGASDLDFTFDLGIEAYLSSSSSDETEANFYQRARFVATPTASLAFRTDYFSIEPLARIIAETDEFILNLRNLPVFSTLNYTLYIRRIFVEGVNRDLFQGVDLRTSNNVTVSPNLIDENGQIRSLADVEHAVGFLAARSHDGTLPINRNYVDISGFVWTDFDITSTNSWGYINVLVLAASLSRVSSAVQGVAVGGLRLRLLNLDDEGASFELQSPTFSSSILLQASDRVELTLGFSNLDPQTRYDQFSFDLGIEVDETGSNIASNRSTVFTRVVGEVVEFSEDVVFSTYSVSLFQLASMSRGNATRFRFIFRNFSQLSSIGIDYLYVYVSRIAVQRPDSAVLLDVNAKEIGGEAVNASALDSDGNFSTAMLGNAPVASDVEIDLPVLAGSETDFVQGRRYLVTRPVVQTVYIAINTSSSQSLQPFDAAGDVNAGWLIERFLSDTQLAAIKTDTAAIKSTTDDLDTIIEADPDNVGDSRLTLNSLSQVPLAEDVEIDLPILTGSENSFTQGRRYLVQRAADSKYYLAIAVASTLTVQPFNSSGNVNTGWLVEMYDLDTNVTSIKSTTDKLDTLVEDDPDNTGGSRLTLAALKNIETYAFTTTQKASLLEMINKYLDSVTGEVGVSPVAFKSSALAVQTTALLNDLTQKLAVYHRVISNSPAETVIHLYSNLDDYTQEQNAITFTTERSVDNSGNLVTQKARLSS